MENVLWIIVSTIQTKCFKQNDLNKCSKYQLIKTLLRLLCLSFQRWMKWVVRKRTQAAAASYLPLPSRTPACWQASPSCSSSPPTQDRYSWASTRLLWTDTGVKWNWDLSQLVCAGVNWPQKENFFFLFVVLPLSVCRTLEFWEFCCCAAGTHSPLVKNNWVAVDAQFSDAVDPRQKGRQPSFLSFIKPFLTAAPSTV